MSVFANKDHEICGVSGKVIKNTECYSVTLPNSIVGKLVLAVNYVLANKDDVICGVSGIYA